MARDPVGRTEEANVTIEILICMHLDINITITINKLSYPQGALVSWPF